MDESSENPQPPRTNAKAIASLVLGIVWACGVGSVLALVLGHKARKEIKGSEGTQKGHGLARAGIALSLVGIAVAVGVVVAIARPTHYRHDAAYNKAAQSSLRNAMAAAKTCSADNPWYYPCNAAALSQIDPALTFVDGDVASNDPGVVSVGGGSPIQIGFASLSRTGACFLLRGDGIAGTTYGQTDELPCTGATALSQATAPSW